MRIEENGIYMNLVMEEGQAVKLIHFSEKPMTKDVEKDELKWYPLAELQACGFDQCDHHGNKHTGSRPSGLMTYQKYSDCRNEAGRKLEITQEYQGLYMTTHLQFYDGIPVIRSWNEVENHSDQEYVIEYISSFALTGLAREGKMPRDKNGIVYLPHNTWYGEVQWKAYTLNELGYDAVNSFSVKRIALSKTGSWACSEYLPMGCYYNTECNHAWTWQIETSGSWHWEISDLNHQLYLQLSGPTYEENGFVKRLKTGENFVSTPCAVAASEGGFEEGIQVLTKYRRQIRRKNADNEELAVIFNDYMNCLMGEPTTEVLLPIIDAAKEAGCEYFCVDAGWYSDGYWWDGVGEWLPSKLRFPGGIGEVITYIRKQGMIPGLWLELEVMGIACPMAKKVSKDWFFQRNGQLVVDHSRYQLDYRNPEVREFANSVIRRLVEEYGVGYIKMDYNIDAGVGTDLHADSAGEGLFEHKQAYLGWLDSIFAAYPDLIIENCSSGGMRMEYSLLSRHSIQSVTDQTNYIKMAAIAANAATACAPEQAAIWSYPLAKATKEEAIFNMINAMLLRIHQSGNLEQICEEAKQQVISGIECYKIIRKDIKSGLPFWPTGLASFSDEYLSFGIEAGERSYLAVWRTSGEGRRTFTIPLHKSGYEILHVECLYPKKEETRYDFGQDTEDLVVDLDAQTARLFTFDRCCQI